MKSKFAVLLLIALLLTGCSAKGENPTNQDFQQAEHTISNATEDNIDVEPVSFVFYSIEELQAAISSEKATEATDEIANSAINLSSLDSVYYPALDFDGYKLFQIEVLQRRIIYYYMPTDFNGEMFSYEDGITVTFKRSDGVQAVSDTSDPMVALSEQAGVPLTKDNILYEKDKNTVTLSVDDTWMAIRVPDELNKYDALVSTLGLDKQEQIATEINMVDFDWNDYTDVLSD